MARDRDEVGEGRRRLEAVRVRSGSDLPRRGEGVREVTIEERTPQRPDGYLGRHREGRR